MGRCDHRHCAVGCGDRIPRFPYCCFLKEIHQKQTRPQGRRFAGSGSAGAQPRGHVLSGKLHEKVIDMEWVTAIEDTLPYIEKAIDEQRRFIIENNEVYRIDKAKIINKDSVKHLIQHTNFIDNIDDRGKVTPNKVLTIEREDSFETYENRFLITLIEMALAFVADKYHKMVDAPTDTFNKVEMERDLVLNNQRITFKTEYSNEVKDAKASQLDVKDYEKLSDFDRVRRIREKLNSFLKTVGGDVLPYVTFSDGGSSVSGFAKYLRCSITVDGATNVYALDDSSTENVYDKTYKTVENGSITDKTGRNIEQFSYYEETFGSNNLPVVNNVANKDANGNLNGNTLFSVGKFDPDNKDGTIKTVTVKIWMECPTTGGAANTVSGVDISSININLVSSWGKTRRIFVHDDTVSEWDAVLNNGENNATGAQWLTNDSNAVLYWALEDSSTNEGYRPFSIKPAPASGDPYVSIAAVSNQSHWFYMDIPAVYNNRSTALFRCNQQWNGGNKHTDNEKTIYYWDKWATTFPDTYHSEVFTIKSHNFATWRNAEDIQQVYFINSAGINENEMKNPHSYMWDSNTVVGNGAGDADKIVKNATWPGEPMTRLANSTAIGGKRLYTFFFLSEFNKAVFSDGRGGTSDAKGYQTQDIDASGHVGHYFDMSALTWYNTSTTGITYTGNYLRSNINQDGTNWAQTCFFHGGGFNETNANNLICRMYVKPQGENSTGNFKFQVKIGDKYYGNNASGNYYNWVDWDLTEGANDINITLDASSIYKFYLKNDNGAWKIKVEKES